ncbi:MAG: PorV/PorQ family protein [bacterium]
MKRHIITVVLICALMVLVAPYALAQLEPDLNQPTEKRAQTGMKFLSVSLDARAAGMGSAMASVAQANSMALFYNPASMGFMESKVDAAIGQTQWIVDINYNYGSLAFRPADGALGVFGLSVVAVDYGEFQGTIRADNELGYQDTGNFSPSALAVGIGYSKSLSDRFSFGANARYVEEKLTDNAPLSTGTNGTLVTEKAQADVFAFDFGVLYKTGFRSLNFGVAARNFASDRTYAEESFELPLTFQMGISMNAMDFTSADKNTHALLVSVDAVRPRDFNEFISFGAEYTLANLVSLRAGYAAPNDENGISLGGGVQKTFGTTAFQVDYAYTDYGVFDNVNRFTFKFSF